MLLQRRVLRKGLVAFWTTNKMVNKGLFIRNNRLPFERSVFIMGALVLLERFLAVEHLFALCGLTLEEHFLYICDSGSKLYLR